MKVTPMLPSEKVFDSLMRALNTEEQELTRRAEFDLCLNEEALELMAKIRDIGVRRGRLGVLMRIGDALQAMREDL